MSDQSSRFWSRLSRGHGPIDCWFIVINENRSGYDSYICHNRPTTVSFRSKPTACHLVAYILTDGDIPKGYVIRHRCANGGCCNPDHFILGTQQENMLDQTARRRAGIPAGELATYEDLLQYL